jgi:cellulose synthase (UDP-forming)
LICSYNEEQAILERTIVGAQAMDYPSLRVWMRVGAAVLKRVLD